MVVEPWKKPAEAECPGKQAVCEMNWRVSPHQDHLPERRKHLLGGRWVAQGKGA